MVAARFVVSVGLGAWLPFGRDCRQAERIWVTTMNTHPTRAMFLHGYAEPAAVDPAIVVVLALAGLGSAVVIGLALAALVRRQSWPYLLVTLALATLLVRTVVAATALVGGMEPVDHHTLEHGLDVAMAALVIAAVYVARQPREAVAE